MKCKHDWRWLKNVFDGEKFYCTKCLAQAKTYYTLKDGYKIEVEGNKNKKDD